MSEQLRVVAALAFFAAWLFYVVAAVLAWSRVRAGYGGAPGLAPAELARWERPSDPMSACSCVESPCPCACHRAPRDTGADLTPPTPPIFPSVPPERPE
jgi:hypothetical protein